MHLLSVYSSLNLIYVATVKYATEVYKTNYSILFVERI